MKILPIKVKINRLDEKGSQAFKVTKALKKEKSLKKHQSISQLTVNYARKHQESTRIS